MPPHYRRYPSVNENNENKKNSNKILIIFLIFITVVAIGVTVWALFFREAEKPPTILAPDYAPVETEGNAESIPGDNTEGRKDNVEGGGSVTVYWSPDVTVDLSDGTASLVFANPGKSNQDMVVQIIIQDLVIVQSGTLPPGNRVRSLDLLDDVASRLTAGIYKGKFNVLFYDPVTGEKAIMNQEILINITVKE